MPTSICWDDSDEYIAIGTDQSTRIYKDSNPFGHLLGDEWTLVSEIPGAAALALASSPIQPVAAQDDGSAADLGVMEINLKDAVQFNWGFQGALQGAGTPNQAGIGAFLPIAIGENSVWFIDA